MFFTKVQTIVDLFDYLQIKVINYSICCRKIANFA